MKQLAHKRTIIGIDPGYGRVGVGVIRQEGTSLRVVTYDCLMPPKGEFVDRLAYIYESLAQIIAEHRPQCISVEKIYFFKNTTTAIDVSQARGVILLAARLQHIPLYEYTPLQVKQAVCGYGKADKQQMQKMVKLLLGLSVIPKPDDAADALALAICASSSNKQLY